MSSAEENEHEAYRVVVLGRDGTEILLVPTGERFTLPSVEIPRWQRVAENLTAAFKRDWGAEIVCLFEVPTVSVVNVSRARYHAAEYLPNAASSQIPLLSRPTTALCGDSLVDKNDYAAVEQVVRICTGESEGPSPGPFCRPGWFHDLEKWIRSIVQPTGMQLTGKFQQLNASPSFSLIRFETNGPALWFKAVGEPNQREFAITLTLTRLFPLYVPCVLATRPEWNAWLTWDAEGELLSDIGETAPWRRVAADLADLQFDSIAKTTGILQSGARDLRIGALSKHLHGFVVVTQELMQRQTKSTPPVLDRERLQLLADRIAHALELLDRLQIPDALGHLDFNPGNVVVSSSRCAFLDWADAYVGNPFLTFEYLLEHFRRTHGTNSPQQSGLVEVYGARWKEALSSEAIQEALAVAPLFAVFSYACGTGMLTDEKRLEDAEFAGYMRGLVRRMDREARALVDRSSKCNTQAVV